MQELRDNGLSLEEVITKILLNSMLNRVGAQGQYRSKELPELSRMPLEELGKILST